MYIMNSAAELSETKDAIEIAAPAKSDFFIDRASGIEKNDAPFYYEKVKGDFVAQVFVKPGFKKNYDAGGLFVMDSLEKWIKLEFEKTDLGYTSVVSVITDGSSDDANGEKLEDAEGVHLQIARKGQHWALHYSRDGRSWKMVRYFELAMKGEVKVGIEAQSPIGKGCTVEYRKFRILAKTIASMRKGK